MKCERLNGREGHPYPNVQAYRRIDGTMVYDAVLPYIRRGRKTSKSVGRFTTAEAAREAVLIAQAQVFEAKAARYRCEAERVISDALTNKTGKRVA